MSRAGDAGHEATAFAATAALAGAALTALAVGGASPAATLSADTLSPVAKTVVVTARGNGHGHGLSQYGAQGAAIAGKTYRQILSFYYPHTKLTRRRASMIDVKLSGFGRTTTVAAIPGLTVTGVSGALTADGVKRYRLVAGTSSGLRLQRLASAAGATWTTVAQVADRAQFRSTTRTLLRLYARGGSSAEYHGRLRAVRRATSGVFTVNRVSLESYTAGVVPREMPASWRRQALDAQAVAARSYAAFERAHATSRDYDICDTTMCQVYGGAARLDASGTVLWRELRSAARDTSRRVLTYRGSAIFAQFSASNGGWTVDGGQPYLVARRDPYDDTASGDPYLARSQRVPVTMFAGWFGLTSLSQFRVSTRDGHGAGGGRILAGYVVGRSDDGASRRVAFTGADLADATASGTTWITVRNA